MWRITGYSSVMPHPDAGFSEHRLLDEEAVQSLRGRRRGRLANDELELERFGRGDAAAGERLQ